MRYKTETEIAKVIESFENCTVPREAWKHAEHLTIALHYALNYTYTTTYDKMKAGILKLLDAFGVDLSREMPYHETLTVFWLETVFEFIKTEKCDSILKTANNLIERYDKDYPLKFYSREFLFSPEARAKFVAGDLKI